MISPNPPTAQLGKSSVIILRYGGVSWRLAQLENTRAVSVRDEKVLELQTLSCLAGG